MMRSDDGLDGVVRLLADRDPVVVGVGECGLDYHYDHSPRDVQRAVFAAQVGPSRRRWTWTLVVHTRQAWDDTFDILASAGPPARWVLHASRAALPRAERGLEMGAMLSSQRRCHLQVRLVTPPPPHLCPLDRLLVETDTLYLAPVPYRGRPNRPALVPVVGAAVAETRGVAAEVVEDATWANTAAVFRLPVDGARTGSWP